MDLVLNYELQYKLKCLQTTMLFPLQMNIISLCGSSGQKLGVLKLAF